MASVYGGLVYRIRKPITLGISSNRVDSSIESLNTNKINGSVDVNDLSIVSIQTDNLSGQEQEQVIGIGRVSTNHLDSALNTNSAELATVQAGKLTGSYTRNDVHGSEDD